MALPHRPGRLVGSLLFVQLAGLILPFVLLGPLAGGTPTYLAAAAANAVQIKVAVALLFANCALTVVISVVVVRALRDRADALALLVLVASVIMFVQQSADSIYVLSMLSLGQRSAETGGSAEFLQAIAATLASTRRWAHVTELLAIDCWIALLYGLLLRSRAVPRALALFGLVTVGLHFTGVPVRMFVGLGPVLWMAASMAPSHVALASWLVVKGFEERGHAGRAAA